MFSTCPDFSTIQDSLDNDIVIAFFKTLFWGLCYETNDNCVSQSIKPNTFYWFKVLMTKCKKWNDILCSGNLGPVSFFLKMNGIFFVIFVLNKYLENNSYIWYAKLNKIKKKKKNNALWILHLQASLTNSCKDIKLILSDEDSITLLMKYFDISSRRFFDFISALDVIFLY